MTDTTTPHSTEEKTPPSPDAAPLRAVSDPAGLILLTVMAAMAVAFAWLPPQPATRSASQLAAASVEPQTRWLRPDDVRPLSRIAFGSCLHQARPQPILASIVSLQPDLFLMIGDNVYGDVKDASLSELRDAYRAQAARLELALLRARIPVLATWDDHDYGRNDGGAEFPWKEGVRQLFAEFWQLDPRALPRGGVYSAQIIGPPGQRVQVILLDTRSFRSPLTARSDVEFALDRSKGRYLPSVATNQDMLGAEQWAWLEAELAKPAEVRVLVSSIQVLAETHGWERWGNLPAERQRLYDVIQRSGAKGLVAISGDRHRAAVYRRDLGGRVFAEITSSALNLPSPPQQDDAGDPVRMGPMFKPENFGLIEIDWRARRLAGTLRDVDGRTVATVNLTFAELGL